MTEPHSPLDRAARAMHASIQPAPDWAWDDPICAPVRAIYRTGIAAALTDLRAPGEGMVQAAIATSGRSEAEVRGIWQAMIDAAIAKG